MTKSETLSDIGEFGLIDKLRRTVHSGRARLAIGDDAAVLPYSRSRDELLAADMLAEGVHFKKTTDPRLIGRKAINSCISDIAAMGGLPRFAVISLGVPARRPVKDIRELYAGINSAARKFDCGIVGGDTIKSPKLIINVAMTGLVQRSQLVRRSGARPGHIIMVTGPLGNSLKSGHHLKFTPRVDAAQYLVKHFKPSAMIDVSDGFLADLAHILEESGVGARIYEDRLPMRQGATLRGALCDGEDFELLFILTKTKAAKLLTAKTRGLRFYPVGEITAKGLTFMTKKTSAITLKHRGYDHYRR